MSADRVQPSRFAEGFLHEARNAVFGLSVTLDALEEETDPGGALVEQARTLAALSDRTARLMHDLVAYVEVPPLQRRPTAFRDLLTESTAAANERLGSRAFVVDGETLLDQEAEVSADQAGFARAICSLIQGIAIAVPSASPVLVTVSRPHAGRVEITIAATGADVSAERAITFFEPFAIRGARISGFAVALARRCLEDHGATVRLARKRDDGLSLILGFDLL